MTGPSSSAGQRAPPLLLLLLLAIGGLLYTGSSGFRIRDTASSDVCHAGSGRCTTPASPSTPWAAAGLRARRSFEPVSTRGGFVKPSSEKEEEAEKEQQQDEVEEKNVGKDRVLPKWKDKKSRSWSKLTKIKNGEMDDESGTFSPGAEDAASDDELIVIEVEEDDDVSEEDDDVVEEDDDVVVEDEEDDKLKEKLQREEERNKKEEERKRIDVEKKIEEMEKRKKEEEEKRRKEKELEEKRRKEEVERRKKEEAEKLKKQEAERRLKEEAARQLKEAAERQRKEEEEERRRKAEEERRRKEEEERKRKEEEDRRRKEQEEHRRREEEERKRKEEEERRRKEQEEHRRREEEERKRKEEERRQKEEAERRKREEERRRKEEEERRLKEEEQKRLQEEKERQLKEEEERRLKEEEDRRLREEEECRLAEEEEKRRLREEEERKKRENEAKEAESKRKEEEQRKKKELEEQKKKQKEEEERLMKEKEEQEIERKRDAEEDKKRVERVKREAEEKKLRDKEERRKRFIKPKKKKDDDDEDEGDEDEDEDNDDNDLLEVKRKIEKIRLAEKEKAKSTEAPRLKPSATKEAKAPAAAKSASKSKTSDSAKKTSEISKTTPTKPVKQLPKKTAVDKAKTTTMPRGSSELMLSLTELNDMILSLPTFVPNFTAVEDLACQQHGKIFLRQLRGYKLWALQMLDSSAKIPAGLLRGNVNQLGDFDQCLGAGARVKVEDKTVRLQGKYCLASIDLYAAHPAARAPVNLMQSRALIRGNLRDPGHFVPRFTTANWAICLPAACSADDARRTIENALDAYNTTVGIKFIVDVDPDMCYVKSKTQSYSKETIGVLYFYAIFVCLAVVATLRDYLGNVQGKGNYSERIIMAFSLKRTLKALFENKETSPSDIGCIHGIRTLSTIALYVAHKLIPTSRIPYANRVSLTEVAGHPLSLLLRASLFYTDSFLLLSGVLTAYNMAKELSSRGEIRWFCRLVARYMRLTPSLLAVVFWYAFVMEHTGSGPQWNSAVKANADICKENAWINLLYVQNFFPFEEMCAAHTHQLALDMQLSLAAPALVFFLQIKPIIGIIVAFFLLQVSATLRYLATSNNNLSLVIFHGMSIKHLYKTANLTYMLPLHRATPYLFGISLGVLLHYVGKNVRLNKISAITGWSIAIALGTWSIFSPWRLAQRDYVYNVEEATHYAVVSPILAALALSWTIFACFANSGGFINRLLSSYWMVVFSKLSYAIYLSQFIVFFYTVGTARYSSEFHPFRALDPLEATSVVLASMVLTLLFDIPMQEVKAIIMECSDTTICESEKSKEAHGENHNNVTKAIPQESFEDEEEIPPGGWNWERGTFTKLGNSEPDEAPLVYRSSRLKRQDVRRQTIVRSDTYEEWDSGGSRRTSRSEEPGLDERRSSRGDYRLSGTSFEDELPGDSYLQPRERAYLSGYNRSPMRDLDAPILRRSLSRERHVSAEPDVPLRDYSNKPLITISKEEDYQSSRSPRSPVPRFVEQQRLLSSESELDLSSSRRSSASYTPRRSSAEPRVVDDDDVEWEDDVRLRRGRFFQERLSSQEREHAAPLPPPIVEEEADDEWDSLRRRSSAEGRMALLKEPLRPGNIALWTVSKIQLGSSQEPDDEEFDEEGYQRSRIEYREQGPPLREEFEPEEQEEDKDGDKQSREAKHRSFASGSLPTSFEEDEEDVNHDFALRKDSKRITVQDLSKLSSDEDTSFETNPNQLEVKPALIKRESMIKSQASEEDPEYLIPERPKLVEQEQEHPLKKAWHMQKSRSEEESSSSFAVRELRSASASLEKQDEEPEEEKRPDAEDEKRPDAEDASRDGPQAGETVSPADVSCDVTLVWQSRGPEPENGAGDGKSRSSSSSSSSSGVGRTQGDEEEDQIDGYRARRKSDEEGWAWTERDT